MEDPDVFYFSNWGPVDGPILNRDAGFAIGVLDRDAVTVGIAYGGPYLIDPKEGPPYATFRLVVNKIELPGYYVCDRRRFIPVEKWRVDIDCRPCETSRNKEAATFSP